MMYFNRNRYFAGNVCFILFLAFFFSLAFTMLPDAAHAQPIPVEQGDEAQARAAAPDGGGVQKVEAIVTTRAEFDTIIKQLLDHLAGANDLVQRIVYEETYKKVYEAVYGTVYNVYQYVLWLVYGPPPSGYTVGTAAYAISYLDYSGSVPGSAYVEVPVPIPKSSGGGGGGGGGAPAPPSGTGEVFESVDIDAGTGTCEAQVSQEQGLAAVESAQPGSTVDFTYAAPAGSNITGFTGHVSARVLLAAIEKKVTTQIGVTRLGGPAGATSIGVALEPERIPEAVRELLQSHPDAKVTFDFKVISGAEAQNAVAGLPDTYRVAGALVTVGLTVSYGDTSLTMPGVLTLAYDAGATAGRGGLFAALDFFGLLDRLAAAGIDEDKLGIYCYNEATGSWEYVGGRVDKVAKRITAKLPSLGTARYAVMAYDKTFTDLAQHWAKRDVEIMAARHVARGITNDLFNPNGLITRAEFAALLIRTLGLKEEPSPCLHFSDVQKGSWYCNAVETAFTYGLLGGYGDGTFRPNARITREEIASMVHRGLICAGKKAVVPSDVEAVLARFGDTGQIAGWAKNSLAVVVNENILRGRDGNVVPKANATRAEATIMLKRSLVSLGELSE